MSDGLTIITNNVPRLVLDPGELTLAERAEFDYLDWHALERGEDSASFVRYRGTLYDLAEFMAIDVTREHLPNGFADWHGYQSDTFFSGVLVRYSDDPNYPYGDAVVMARYYS